MAAVVLHTGSLENSIKADIVMSIKETDDINKKIQELAIQIQEKLISVEPGWMHVLHVICNGTEEGLQLGRLVDDKNIAKIFEPLRFKVGSIVIHGCAAAAIYSKANNGVLMCKKLARAVYANVTASNAIPVVSTLNHIFNGCNKNLYLNNGGTIGEWNQSGKLIFIQEYSEDGNPVPNGTHLRHHTKNHFKISRSASDALPESGNSKFSKKNLLRAMKLKKISALYLYFSHFLHAILLN